MPGKRHNLSESPCNEPAAGSGIESRFCGTEISVGYNRMISIPKTDKCGHIQPPGTPETRIPQQSASSTPFTSSIKNSNQECPSYSPENRTPPRSLPSLQQDLEVDTNGVPALVPDDLSIIFPVTSSGFTRGVGPEQQVSGTPSQDTVVTVGLLLLHIPYFTEETRN